MKPKPKPPTHGGKRANAGREHTGKTTVSSNYLQAIQEHLYA